MHIVYYNAYRDYFGVFTEQYVYTYTKFRLVEILYSSCPCRNEWPEVVYLQLHCSPKF